MDDILESSRLLLKSKTVEGIKASFYGDKSLESFLGCKVRDGFLGENFQLDVFPLHYARITEDPSLSKWSGFIIEKDSNELVGCAGFEDKPNQRGEIELRFYIHPFYRQQGYAKEIVQALSTYYLALPNVKTIVASRISDENIPAIKVLRSVGMELIKQRENELYFALHKLSSYKHKRSFFRRKGRLKI